MDNFPDIFFFRNNFENESHVRAQRLVSFMPNGDGTAVAIDHGETIYHCMYVDRDKRWVLHSITQPALINVSMGTKLFFHYGRNFKIEDIPSIDGITKMILTLKFEQGYNQDYANGYVWYV